MNKPVVFFSHSSKDKAVLAKLKELFVEKTGATVEVFLSSDGQSIQLGRNWVHRVEKGLVEAKFMIVFVTPNSLESNWIYFEAGYAHSRDIRVIPVGFLGVDLGTLRPPLSLLQGFNISSHEGLNNIIAVTNEEFGFKHAESFSSHDHESISILGDSQSIEEGDRLPEDMEELRVSVDLEGKDRFAEIVEQAKELGLVAFQQKSWFKFLGGMVSHSEDNTKTHISFSFSRQFWQAKFALVTQLINTASASGFVGTNIECLFPSSYEVIESQHRVGGLLMDMNIGFSEGGLLTFGSMPFRLGVHHSHSMSARSMSSKRAQAYVIVTPHSREINTRLLAELLQSLRSRGAIAPPAGFLPFEL